MTSPNSPIADRILDRMTPVRLGPPRWLRLLLAVVAAAQVVIAIPWLVGADPAGLLGEADASHMTRDGAFGLAIGLAGLVTAWRHRYAIAAGILSVSILAVQFGTGLIDGHADRVRMWVEVSHLPMTLITALILLAARPERSLGSSRSVEPESESITRSERLRLVNPARDD